MGISQSSTVDEVVGTFDSDPPISRGGWTTRKSASKLQENLIEWRWITGDDYPSISGQINLTENYFIHCLKGQIR